MARIETWLRCNLQSMVRVQELSGDLFTADNQANRIGVIVTDNNGQPVQLTGGVIGYIIRPDEETVVVNGSISSNRAWIDLPASAYVVKGPISIVIKNGNTTIAACHGYIKRSITDHIVDPGHEIPSLSELLAEIANMRTATSAANTAAGAANSAAGAANTAATNANNKASAANTAAGSANEAATNANGAAGKINNMTVSASGLTAGSVPTVAVSDVSDHKHILFGIPKGDKGDPGKDFRIKRTFTSIAQMEAYDPSQDQSEYKVLEFDYVMIDTGSVSDVDTGKLYCYEPQEQTVWHYIGDLSGAQGIKGETGNGISSVQLNQDYTLTITYTNGSSVTTASIRGAKGDKGDTGDTGAQGPIGATPHLTIGTVTDLPAGSTPTAEFTGTDANPVLNLGLVHGASGNETIDDTAGIGDTDLVYSADKVVKLFRSEHEDLTSGNAEQVIGKVASTEKGAYLYRRGMHLGNRCREKVVGGTVAWNQLVQNGNFASNSGWNAIGGTLSVSNNKATASITSDGNLQFYRSITPKISGHKVAVMFMCKTASEKSISVNWGANLGTTHSTTSLTPLGLIGQVSSTGNENLNIIVSSLSNGDTVEIKNVMLFDLTAMFGSVIADTLYGMGEAGVAWFRERFSKDYYAYDAGSLQSVQAASKKTTGKNFLKYTAGSSNTNRGITCTVQDDGTIVVNGTATQNYSWDFKTLTYKDLPHGVYKLSGKFASGYGFYIGLKKNGSTVASDIATTYTNDDVQFDTTPYDYDSVIVGIYVANGSSYSGKVTYPMIRYASVADSSYEPYVERTYPFDSDLVLRGIHKLDSNNRLYYDGDEYESSGKVTRKYGIVDLGTLTWSKVSVDSYYVFSADRFGMSGNYNFICEKYVNSKKERTEMPDKTAGSYNDGNAVDVLVIRDDSYASSDAATFKTAMSGVYLVYELAAPTTEQASPFTPIMSFDPAGTEEFTEWGTRDVAIPVGHITEYLTDPAKILNNIPLIEVEKESTSVVTFSDGAEGLPLKELTVKVEPVQDLHGYANPWPAGGGKNIFGILLSDVKTINTDGTWSGNVYTINNMTFTFTADSEGYVNSVSVSAGTPSANTYVKLATVDTWADLPAGSYTISGCPAGGSDTTYCLLGQFIDGTTNKTTYDTGSGGTVNASESLKLGSGRNISILIISGVTVTAKTFKPMLCISSASNPTTFAPYSNICPISGWTGENVVRTGKNTLHWGFNEYTKTENGVTFTYHPETGELTVSGTATQSGYLWNSFVEDRQTRNENRYFYKQSTGTVPSIGTQLEREDGTSYGEGLDNGEQMPNRHIIKQLYLSLTQNTVYNGVYKFGVIIGDANAFDPYEKQTYSITFPSSAGTVYGGTVKVEKDGTGKLTVNRTILDLGAQTYENLNDGYFRIFQIAVGAKFVNQITAVNGISSIYIVDSQSHISNDHTISFNNATQIYFHDSSYSDATAFKTAMNGQTLVYEIATPITYSLTPVEIETLLGINNIWADTGNVSLTYRADTKKYIDAKIAELSAAITALGT